MHIDIDADDDHYTTITAATSCTTRHQPRQSRHQHPDNHDNHEELENFYPTGFVFNEDSQNLIAIASKNGAMVTPLAEKHPFVRIEFVSSAGSISDSEIGRIIPTVRFNLTQLDLSKTKVTDKGLLNVGKCESVHARGNGM